MRQALYGPPDPDMQQREIDDLSAHVGRLQAQVEKLRAEVSDLHGRNFQLQRRNAECERRHFAVSPASAATPTFRSRFIFRTSVTPHDEIG